MVSIRRGIAVLLTATLFMGAVPVDAGVLNSTQTTQQTQGTTGNSVLPKIVTPKNSLPKKTKRDELTVKIQSVGNTVRTYHIFHQKAKKYSKNSYIYTHGCATSALTTVLSAYSLKYNNLTPLKTYGYLEKKILGASAWNRNYRKRMNKRMPISLYGFSTVLTRVGIRNTYVPTFKNTEAVKMIKNHLYGGNPVVIEVNSHKQVDGKFSNKYTSRWTFSKHTMVLLGMTNDGRAIIADSSNRVWSKNEQRIKYAKVEELVKYMIPTKYPKKVFYFTHYLSCGGFVLVNP